MLLILAWLSPGIFMSILYLIKWLKGNDITYGDVSDICIMFIFSIFIVINKNDLLNLEDPRRFIAGRKR